MIFGASSRSRCSSADTLRQAQRVGQEAGAASGSGAPTMTLSSTVMVRNSARFWKVRPMPSAAMPCVGVAVIDWPSNRMSPRLVLVEAAAGS